MVGVTKYIFRIGISLFLLWLDFNLMSRLLVFDLRLSLLLLLVILLHNYQDININGWYLPIFILGIINDLIIPSSYIGLTSFFLMTSLVAIGKIKQQNYLNFIIIVLIGDIIFYSLVGISIMAVSGVSLTFLLLNSLIVNISKLVLVNFVFQLIVLGIFNFGREDVY